MGVVVVAGEISLDGALPTVSGHGRADIGKEIIFKLVITQSNMD